MSERHEHLLTELGFRFGANGPHAARTMMLDDLRTLFQHVPVDADRADYAEAVVAHNVLTKPTKKSRELAFRHMATLYGMDRRFALFRALRRLWSLDEGAQPVLALSAALARDPLLRETQAFIRSQQLGAVVHREDLEQVLASQHPNGFSPASLKSFAQNVNGTWTAAGFLVGRIHKTRSTPIVTPANVAFCLLLGYMEGLSGQRLFTSQWMSLFNGAPAELEALATAASQRGLLVFLNAGGVKELRFPGYLTPEEERLRHEVSHVV